MDIPTTPVPIFRLFTKMGGWIVLILGAILVMLSLISQSNSSTAQRFETEGRPAVAVVTEKYERKSRDSEGNRKVTYWLTLDYVTTRGEDISLNRKVRVDEYNRARQGEEFDLRYLERDPRQTELTPGSFKSGSNVLQGIALAMGLICLVGLWIIGGWAVAAVRARRYGTREEAKVVEVRRTRTKINQRPRYRLVWRDNAGREGQSLLHEYSDLVEYRPGDIIHIYQGVKFSWWVGDIGERPEFAT